MHKIGIIVCLLAGYTATSGQVCNTANVLKSGQFSLGIAPVCYVNYNNDIGVYLTGGLGIAKQVDLSFKFLFNDHSTYFGGDFEFVLLHGFSTMSFAGGMHAHGTLGLDATLNVTCPIHAIAALYGGIDSDIEFHDNSTDFPVWGFLGFQGMVRRSLALFMEIDIGIDDPAPDMFVVGFHIFF